MAQTLARAAVDQKGEQVRILEVADLLFITDYFLLVTTASSRQTRALAEALNDAARAEGHPKGRIEGTHQSTWVLLDFGEVVCHLLTGEARTFYALDTLWADGNEVPFEGDDSRTREAG